MKKFLYPIILILVIAGMYFSAVGFPFIGYDNNEFIIENPLLSSWSSGNFTQIWKIGGVALENLYIPLTYVTYYFETAVFGKNPYIIHLDNLLLHLANCLLLFYLARRIGLEAIYAFIASLAFAIHPLQVEPVVWCMGRKDLLSTLFALLCMHCYLSYASKKQLRWIIMTLILGISAMLAKPVMVILPGILFLIELFLLESYGGNDVDTTVSSFKKFIVSCLTQWKISKQQSANQNGFVIRKLLISLLSCYSILTVYFNLSGPFRAPSTRTPYENSLCLIYLLSGWLRRFFMVDSLEHFYRPPSTALLYSKTTGGFILLLIAAILILYITVLSKYDKKFIFGFTFFVIAFLPPLAHLKYTQEFITADRYGYFPLIGIFISLVAFYRSFSGKRKKILTIILTVWFFFLFINNFSAVRSWSSDISFWELEVYTKPESAIDNYFLGLSYQKAGDYQKALACYENCITKENAYTQKALISSGSIFFYIKQFGEAEIFYREALKYKSEYIPLIYFNLGETYRMQRNIDQALEAYKKSINPASSNGEVFLRIAQIYLYKKDKKTAKIYADKARAMGVEWTEDLKINLNELQK